MNTDYHFFKLFYIKYKTFHKALNIKHNNKLVSDNQADDRVPWAFS